VIENFLSQNQIDNGEEGMIKISSDAMLIIAIFIIFSSIFIFVGISALFLCCVENIKEPEGSIFCLLQFVSIFGFILGIFLFLKYDGKSLF
jgi:hypothetical protein